MSRIGGTELGILPAEDSDNTKVVPQKVEARERIRAEVRQAALGLNRHRSLRRAELKKLAAAVLDKLGLPPTYLGFTMVAANNEFWRDQFAAVPHSRRLLLLPHCLRDREACQGTYSALGLTCAECGACELLDLKREAEALGYKVLIAEGTPAVVQLVLSGRADALLGVACLDSFEEAFANVAEMGIPHVAVPLLRDGCADTVAELDVVRRWMCCRADPVGVRTRSYVPLLRAAEALFEDNTLDALLDGQVELSPTSSADHKLSPLASTEAIALDWLRRGGKRFRPFITLASYTAIRQGKSALNPQADLIGSFSTGVRQAAVAIEALHKASLVHDDIEDDDAYRYGEETLHRRYGSAMAINVGDYLVGLGYRLMAAGKDEFGAACAADILSHLSQAHLKLCRGQGAELLWRQRGTFAISPRPRELMVIYALKTAPAFEAGMYAGLRMAQSHEMGHVLPDGKQTLGGGSRKPSLALVPASIHQFSRYVGVAYQVLNDLKEWNHGSPKRLPAEADLLWARPTILRAFALEQDDSAVNRELLDIPTTGPLDKQQIERLHEIYQRWGVFDKADKLVEKFRCRARALADQVKVTGLGELMHFVMETVL